VQQVLVFSARHLDTADPDLTTNGAGLRVSHNLGYGIPDAGEAVRLARAWSNRPPVEIFRFIDSLPGPVPDDGLRVELSGADVPASLASLPATGGLGLHPDAPTDSLELFDAGLASSPITENLTGRGALILRGGADFVVKINHAADAGAAFAVIANDRGGDSRMVSTAPQFRYMRGTDFARIPAVLISENDGNALKAHLAAHPQTRVREFEVPDALVCEHVAVRLRMSHPSVADVRITLRSPAGTLSILQRPGMNTQPAEADYTYWSTRHFLEGTAGVWTLSVTDEWPGALGSITDAELVLHGTSITDTEGDGLDDGWELGWFGNLFAKPAEDADHDGYNNAREQAMGTNPLAEERPFVLDLSHGDASRVRLSWPGATGRSYEVLASPGLDAAFAPVGIVPGSFPESGLWWEHDDVAGRLFRVRELPSAP